MTRQISSILAAAMLGWPAAGIGGEHAAPFGGTAADADREEWIELFNGRDLDEWLVKFTHHDLGLNLNDTFRVEDGLLKIRYDKWNGFNGEFGHLFYDRPFSYYRLIIEYRFVGRQLSAAGPLLQWAIRNNGVMLHSQDPQTMALHQDFPISVEVQLLGALDDGKPRPTANVCTPGTHVVYQGSLDMRHCIESASETYAGDQWVRVEVLVDGNELIRHSIDGRTVLQYGKPQIGGGVVTNADPSIMVDGTPLHDGYIAVQAETAETDFRKIVVLNLEGCMEPSSRHYKSYFVKSNPSMCLP